ncbi:MAG: hypothetical protein LBI04_11600 [Treponema sp.]|jgi:hypothetical protein|nr:hypothetical protein [Treponema sp.]
MANNIQVPFLFFRDVFRLVLLLDFSDIDNEDIKALCKSLNIQMSAKLDAMSRHKSFSAYKSAPHGSDVRESFRREYLDKAGIHKDWRSDKEVSFFE